MDDRLKIRTWTTEKDGRVKEELFEIDRIGKKKEAVIMQCIGIRDKNGVLIYEGDVIKEDDIDDELYYVTYKPLRARFVLNCIKRNAYKEIHDLSPHSRYTVVDRYFNWNTGK